MLRLFRRAWDRQKHMNAMNEIKYWAQSHTDIALDLVRIYLGFGLMIKGIYFMGHGELVQQLLAGNDDSFFLRAAIAHYVVPVHLAGGALLALGLLTRVAALSQVPVLLGAILYLYLPKAMLLEPRQNLEFAALVLFLVLLFVVFGAGRLSLDNRLFRHGDVEHALPERAPA